jgi:hypothetical protein
MRGLPVLATLILSKKFNDGCPINVDPACVYSKLLMYVEASEVSWANFVNDVWVYIVPVLNANRISQDHSLVLTSKLRGTVITVWGVGANRDGQESEDSRNREGD